MELIRCCLEADITRKSLELPQSEPSRQSQPGSFAKQHTDYGLNPDVTRIRVPIEG